MTKIEHYENQGSYKPYKNIGCICGCGKHCGHSCMTDDCDCTECDCYECKQDNEQRGYN